MRVQYRTFVIKSYINFTQVYKCQLIAERSAAAQFSISALHSLAYRHSAPQFRFHLAL